MELPRYPAGLVDRHWGVGAAAQAAAGGPDGGVPDGGGPDPDELRRWLELLAAHMAQLHAAGVAAFAADLTAYELLASDVLLRARVAACLREAARRLGAGNGAAHAALRRELEALRAFVVADDAVDADGAAAACAAAAPPGSPLDAALARAARRPRRPLPA
jgi:hypothetical protein